MNTTRVALVGLGDIGLGAHLPALLRHDSVEVAALVDTSAERRAAVPRYGIDVVDDLDGALALGLDGVVLATPPWATPELTVRCAKEGLFVLAEKPVAVSVEAAAAYDVLSQAQQGRIQIGLTYRHDPGVQRLGQRIADGTLGAPLLVRAHIYDERRGADEAHTARITATLAHGMPVIHEGAHVFDWLSHLLGGQPEQVEDAWSLGTRPGLPNPNLVGARLRYPGGHVALVEFGWLTEALPRCELSVLGDRGSAVLDVATFELRLATANDERSIVPAASATARMARCFDRQVERFVELCTGLRKSGEPSLYDGIAALRTAERVAEIAVGGSR
ncbi:Gfo/Idh/MocA family protein [Kribbella swartbergensis]